MTFIELAFLVATSCPSVKMENKTKYPWNDFDNKSLTNAKMRCGELYKKSPCVKLFRKTNKKDYSVICGKTL